MDDPTAYLRGVQMRNARNAAESDYERFCRTIGAPQHARRSSSRSDHDIAIAAGAPPHLAPAPPKVAHQDADPMATLKSRLNNHPASSVHEARSSPNLKSSLSAMAEPSNGGNNSGPDNREDPSSSVHPKVGHLTVVNNAYDGDVSSSTSKDSLESYLQVDGKKHTFSMSNSEADKIKRIELLERALSAAHNKIDDLSQRDTTRQVVDHVLDSNTDVESCSDKPKVSGHAVKRSLSNIHAIARAPGPAETWSANRMLVNHGTGTVPTAPMAQHDPLNHQNFFANQAANRPLHTAGQEVNGANATHSMSASHIIPPWNQKGAGNNLAPGDGNQTRASVDRRWAQGQTQENATNRYSGFAQSFRFPVASGDMNGHSSWRPSFNGDQNWGATGAQNAGGQNGNGRNVNGQNLVGQNLAGQNFGLNLSGQNVSGQYHGGQNLVGQNFDPRFNYGNNQGLGGATDHPLQQSPRHMPPALNGAHQYGAFQGNLINTQLSPTANEFNLHGAPPHQPYTGPSSPAVSSVLETGDYNYGNGHGLVPTGNEQLNYRHLLEANIPLNWANIVDRIVQNNDQQSSIFLQQKLRVVNNEQRHDIVQAIIAKCFDLMTNRFGNFLVQRCFEHGTSQQILDIAQTIHSNVVRLSMDPFGCHVVQKAFDAVPENEKAIMVHEMLVHIPETVVHRYACHVWQKLFELRWINTPPQIMKYVNEALSGMWHEVALGETGSLVVQNIFENCLEEDKRPCVNEVLASIDVIAHGQFGNWCIQHICEHGAPADRRRALDHILRFAFEYSIDQYASKVIEKCLKVGAGNFIEHYLMVVCEPRHDRPRLPLIDIACDQFGNYLIQWVLMNSTATQKDVISNHVRKHMVSLRGSRYGARVAMLCADPALHTRPGPPSGMQIQRYAQPHGFYQTRAYHNGGFR